jgi:DNA-binding NtrC family response regulator
MTKRIRVVEDQEDFRGVLRTLRTGSGYAIIEAADGQAGVAQAKAERPDLILMDIQRPVLDGYDATPDPAFSTLLWPTIAPTPLTRGVNARCTAPLAARSVPANSP